MLDGDLKLFASPGSPPAGMKSNNDMLHGGTLLPYYYSTWANYYTKFIKSYGKEGVLKSKFANGFSYILR